MNIIIQPRYLSLGSYNKLPHYAVIGDPLDFYVWIEEDKRVWFNSDWIKGQEAFRTHIRLKKMLEKKQRHQFIELVKELMNKHRKK